MNIKELSLMAESRIDTRTIPFKLFGNVKIVEKADGDRIIAGYACVSADTDILTDNGWKNHDTIKSTDMVLTWNPESNKLEYQNFLSKWNYKIDDDVLHIKSASIDTITTLNHRWFVRGYRCDDRVKLSYQIAGSDKIPTTGNYDNDEIDISDDMLRLLSWIITEGHFRVDRRDIRINITEYYDEIDALLKRIGISFSHNIYQNKKENHKDTHCFLIHSDDGEKIRQLIPNKRFTRKILNSSKRQLGIIFDTLMKGDGGHGYDKRPNRNKRLILSYHEEHYDLISQVQEIALKIGKKFNINMESKQKGGDYDAYITDRKDVCAHNRIIEKYQGDVWCVTVPNSFFVARRNGKHFITGNSVAVIDSQEQLITTDALKKGIESLLSDPSYANLMLTHKNIQVGRIIPSYGNLKTRVDDKGLYIIAEIRKDIKTADNLWQSILNGELNGFSIGCEILSEPERVCNIHGEDCKDVLNDINIFEVSICQFPVNEMSGFVVISKSKFDANNLSDVCKDCDINNDTMKKKIKTEVKEEDTEPSETEGKTDDDTVELSVEERIENMERAIFNIEAALSKITEVKQEDPEEKEDKSETETKDEKPAEDEPTEEKADNPQFVTKEDFDVFKDELTKSIGEQFSNLFEKKKEESEMDEMKMAIKARDDQIDAQKKKIEILSKADVESKEPKTVQKGDEDADDEIEVFDDNGIVIKDGIVKHSRLVY